MANLIVELSFSDTDQVEFLKKFPNTEVIPDPAWIDPRDGRSAPNVPKYADKEWIVERTKRLINGHLNRNKFKTAQKQITIDESTVSATTK